MSNRVVIVTGGNGLLGREMIKDLKKDGYQAINFDINHRTNLENRTVYCDITSGESIDEALTLVKKEFGEVYGLVNNAYPRTKDWGVAFDEIPMSSWQRNIDIQLNSVFYLCQKVLREMKILNRGSIVNISSIYGVVGNDMAIYENTEINPPAAYSAIKGGVVNFSRYLAAIYGEFGIRINCVSPGGIFNNQPTPFVKSYEKKVPMKRLGTPEDIAPAVTFLISYRAKYITGHNLMVDGGWTAI